jgi:hypothetical protein
MSSHKPSLCASTKQRFIESVSVASTLPPVVSSVLITGHPTDHFARLEQAVRNPVLDKARFDQNVPNLQAPDAPLVLERTRDVTVS